MTIEEVVDRSTKYNLGAIITEHMDLNYRDDKQFRFNVQDYFNDYEKYRGNELLLGIEIGMCNENSKEYERICKEHPFDYVLGSLHEMHDFDLYDADSLYKSKSKDELYEEYFLQIVDRLKKHEFVDSLAHIDYLSRCAQYEDREMYYEQFKDGIDGVLKTLVDKDISIEINTRRLGESNAVENLIKIYKRYNELGGSYVTIGSDAHTVENIGKHFQVASDMAELCNLKMIYYKNRKREIV
jgi:histidinol-phosphatase (PHP family)